MSADTKAEQKTQGPLVRKIIFIQDLASDKSLSRSAFRVAVLLVTKWLNDTTGRLDPSFGTIAKTAEIDRKTAIKAVEELEEGGWFKVERRRDEAGDSTSNKLTPVWDRAERARKAGDPEPDATGANDNLPPAAPRWTGTYDDEPF